MGYMVNAISPKDLANLAGVSEESATAFLQSHKDMGVLDFRARSIRFYDRRGRASVMTTMQQELA